MAHEFINLTPGRLSCDTFGHGQEILFLHGGIATPKAYTPLLNLLSKKCHILAPTHPGHGDSFGLSPGWKLESFIDVYLELLQVKKCKPEYVIGHSFGGLMALMLSRKLPGLKCIAMAPLLEAHDLSLNKYITDLTVEVKTYLSSKSQIPRTALALRSLMQTLIKHPDNPSWFLDKLKQIDIPRKFSTYNQTTMIFGKDDRFVSHKVGREHCRLLTACNYIRLENEGHLFPVSNPEMTYKLIRKIIYG